MEFLQKVFTRKKNQYHHSLECDSSSDTSSVYADAIDIPCVDIGPPPTIAICKQAGATINDGANSICRIIIHAIDIPYMDDVPPETVPAVALVKQGTKRVYRIENLAFGLTIEAGTREDAIAM